MRAPVRRVLLSEQQVATALRTDVAALRRMRASGIGPAYRVLPDGRVCFTAAAVRAWLTGPHPGRWRTDR